jgi:hypothetical protein
MKKIINLVSGWHWGKSIKGIRWTTRIKTMMGTHKICNSNTILNSPMELKIIRLWVNMGMEILINNNKKII